MTEQRCMVVMYHYVGVESRRDDCVPAGLTTDGFARQLDLLTEAFRIVNWAEFTAWRSRRLNLDRPAALLTFDDGLADHHRVVADLLDARNLRGVFFVPTEPVITRRLDVAHQIHVLLSFVEPETLLSEVKHEARRRIGESRHDESRRDPIRDETAVNTLPSRDVGASDDVAASDGSAATAAALRYSYESPVRAELKQFVHYGLPIESRGDVVGAVFDRHVGDARTAGDRWYMTIDQLVDLQRRGHVVGGHGHSHAPLDRLSEASRIKDLRRCAALLNQHLGPADRPFSYPFGGVNDAVATRCRAAGFVNGFTTRSSWATRDTCSHLIGRIDTIDVTAFLESEREFTCQPV